MGSIPIEYAPSGRAGRSYRWMIVVGVVVGIGVLGLFVPTTVAVRQVQSRVDAVTGSMEWTTTWASGSTTGPVVTPSGLELRLVKMGVTWTRDWRFLHNTHRTLTGRAVCFECGTAPPIYGIGSVLTAFAAAATDAELMEFVRVMQQGTDAEQRAAVDAAADKALAAMGARNGSPR